MKTDIEHPPGESVTIMVDCDWQTRWPHLDYCIVKTAGIGLHVLAVHGIGYQYSQKMFHGIRSKIGDSPERRRPRERIPAESLV
jgi:hypothetical protein